MVLQDRELNISYLHIIIITPKNIAQLNISVGDAIMLKFAQHDHDWANNIQQFFDFIALGYIKGFAIGVIIWVNRW